MEDKIRMSLIRMIYELWPLHRAVRKGEQSEVLARFVVPKNATDLSAPCTAHFTRIACTQDGSSRPFRKTRRFFKLRTDARCPLIALFAPAREPK
jgi:hypothetical protein